MSLVNNIFQVVQVVARYANVLCFSGSHTARQRGQSLLHDDARIKAKLDIVRLNDVHIVKAQSLEACLDAPENGLSREVKPAIPRRSVVAPGLETKEQSYTPGAHQSSVQVLWKSSPWFQYSMNF